MDKDLLNKERTLERVKVDNEIETNRAEIAQKKAVEKELKHKYGRDWRKLLGLNTAGLQDYYALDPSLRDLSRPPRALRH